MCGIAGFIGRMGRDDAQAIAESMALSLNHRGPDHHGTFVEPISPEIFLGFSQTLLAIIGKPGEGIQPFKVPEGVLIFNGAIYNYISLREELIKSGRHFHTHTDTEVLAHGLAMEGPEFLSRLRGMFAFAFWHHKKRILWLGRDPFGVKPLYIVRNAEHVLFASEYKALLPYLPGVQTDETAIYDYLRLRYVPENATLFREIRKVAPGSVAEIKVDSLRSTERKYYVMDVPGHAPDSAGLIKSSHRRLNGERLPMWRSRPF